MSAFKRAGVQISRGSFVCVVQMKECGRAAVKQKRRDYQLGF